jgi:hypothetical protein
MPAAACDDSRPYQSTINGECDFMVDWTWDGSSTPFPGGCQGTIDSISWENRSASTYYAHIHGTRVGDVCKVIAPGASGTEQRQNVLRAAGLQTLADIRGDLILDRFPPIASEILIQ